MSPGPDRLVSTKGQEMMNHVAIAKVPIGTTVEFFSGVYVTGKIIDRYSIGNNHRTWVVLQVEGEDRPRQFSYGSHRSVRY